MSNFRLAISAEAKMTLPENPLQFTIKSVKYYRYNYIASTFYVKITYENYATKFTAENRKILSYICILRAYVSLVDFR